MRHYDLETWTDYVREALPVGELGAMRRHLEGCAACSERVARLAGVARVMAADRRVEAPAGAVRSVKAMFRQRGLAADRRPAERLQLVFDSFLAPAPAGVRNGIGEGRHLMYMSSQLSLDLQLLPAGSDRLHVVGEVVAREAGQLAGVPVALVTGGRVLSRDTTGGRGDFDLHCKLSPGLVLRLEPPQGGPVELEIPLASARSGA